MDRRRLRLGAWVALSTDTVVWNTWYIFTHEQCFLSKIWWRGKSSNQKWGGYGELLSEFLCTPRGAMPLCSPPIKTRVPLLQDLLGYIRRSWVYCLVHWLWCIWRQTGLVSTPDLFLCPLYLLLFPSPPHIPHPLTLLLPLSSAIFMSVSCSADKTVKVWKVYKPGNPEGKSVT